MHITTSNLIPYYLDILFGKAVFFLANLKMWLNHSAIECWAFAFTSFSSDISANPFRFSQALVQETKPIFEAEIGRKMTMEETDLMLSDLVDFYQILFEIESKSKSPELVLGETKIVEAA